MSDTCLFCRIARGEIPAQIVYQDPFSVVFKDSNPQAPVHLLAIPREHFAAVHDGAATTSAHMARLFEAISAVLAQEQLCQRGYRLVINSGAEAGQAVFHLHVHILSGRALGWPPG